MGLYEALMVIERAVKRRCRVVVGVGVDLGLKGLGIDAGGAGLDRSNDTDSGRVGVC